MWPVSRGCLLLRGTWSYLRICRGSVLLYTRFCNCLLIMITFYTLLTSLFCIVKQQQLTLLHKCRAPMFTSFKKGHWGETKIWWTNRLCLQLLDFKEWVSPSADWLFTVLPPARESCTDNIRRHYHCWSRATKFRSMCGAQGLWTRMDLYLVTAACDTEFRFYRSHTKVRLIQSPLKTCTRY
jgi:hypothetical protein